MIVRNEEARLAACLASVKGFADEMVLVDTGSVDATVAIAEAAGARVLQRSAQNLSDRDELGFEADLPMLKTLPSAHRAYLSLSTLHIRRGRCRTSRCSSTWAAR